MLFDSLYIVYVGWMQIYPLVICYIAIENDPVEIVDVPIKHGDFSIVM